MLLSSSREHLMNVEGFIAKKMTVFFNTLQSCQQTNGKDFFFEETTEMSLLATQAGTWYVRAS